MARIVRVLIRVLVVFALGIGLGAAAYFGAPRVYRDVVLPVEMNTERIAELQQAIDQLKRSQVDREAQSEQRLARAESEITQQGETMAEMQAHLGALQSDLGKQTERLAALEDLADLVSQLAAVQDSTAEDLGALTERLTGAEAPLQKLERQLQLIRVMEIITRARLWLIADNLGLAEDDLILARDALEAVVVIASEAEVAGLEEVLERIELAIVDLKSAPVIAADDLEIAWRLLQDVTGLEPVLESDQ